MEDGVGGELKDHVMQEGEEDDGCLFSCGDWWFPKEFQVVEETDGDEEFFNVGVWWNGMGVTEIAAEVGGKTVASVDPIRDVGVGHIVTVSKTKVMNEGLVGNVVNMSPTCRFVSKMW